MKHPALANWDMRHDGRVLTVLMSSRDGDSVWDVVRLAGHVIKRLTTQVPGPMKVAWDPIVDLTVDTGFTPGVRVTARMPFDSDDASWEWVQVRLYQMIEHPEQERP